MYDPTDSEDYRDARRRYLEQIAAEPRRSRWTDDQWDRDALLRLVDDLACRLRQETNARRALEQQLMQPLFDWGPTVAELV
jgi:hypothetical protein